LDNIVAGARTAWTAENARTLTATTITATAELVGVPEGAAYWTGEAGDFAVDALTGALLAKRLKNVKYLGAVGGEPAGQVDNFVGYGDNTIAAVGQQLDNAAANARPIQNHHFATPTNKKYTPRMQEIAERQNLSLEGDWNRGQLPHQGRHPDAYHQFVLDSMREADSVAGANQDQFLKLFGDSVREPVLQNPDLLRKAGWEQ